MISDPKVRTYIPNIARMLKKKAVYNAFQNKKK